MTLGVSVYYTDQVNAPGFGTVVRLSEVSYNILIEYPTNISVSTEITVNSANFEAVLISEQINPTGSSFVEFETLCTFNLSNVSTNSSLEGAVQVILIDGTIQAGQYLQVKRE